MTFLEVYKFLFFHHNWGICDLGTRQGHGPGIFFAGSELFSKSKLGENPGPAKFQISGPEPDQDPRNQKIRDPQKGGSRTTLVRAPVLHIKTLLILTAYPNLKSDITSIYTYVRLSYRQLLCIFYTSEHNNFYKMNCSTSNFHTLFKYENF